MMTSRELNKKLINAFPELESAYKEYTEWQDGDETGSHVVYCHILAREIAFLIKGKRYDKAKPYLDFCEDLLLTGDEYADEVVALSVLDFIATEEGCREADVLPLLGPATLKVWREIVDWRPQ